MSKLSNDRFTALTAALRIAGIPIDGLALLSFAPPTVRVDYSQAATPQQRTDGDALVAAFDWSQASQDATNVQDTRSQAAALLSSPEGAAKLLRGVAQVLLDELNILRAAVPRAIVSITRAGTVATAITADPHGLANGNTVRIQGATLAAYNVTAAVTVTNPTAFTYAVAGSPVTPAAGTLSYTLGVVPAMGPRTLAQAKTAILAAISAGLVDS